MSEMVERVARALANQYASGHDLDHIEINEFVDAEWLNFEREARTAIAAMREPTEAMVVAGEGVNEYDCEYAVGNIDPTAAWQAMIDEALK